LFVSHGAFVTRAAAVQWAEEERQFMEGPGWTEPLPPIRLGPP
jgi:hypothetical protein